MALKKTIRLTQEEQEKLDVWYAKLSKNSANNTVPPTMGMTVELGPKNKKLVAAGEQEGLWKVITTQSWFKMVLPEYYQAALDKEHNPLRTPSEEKAAMALDKKKKKPAKKKPAAKAKAKPAKKKPAGKKTVAQAKKDIGTAAKDIGAAAKKATPKKAAGGRKVTFPSDQKYKVKVNIPKKEDALKELIGCRPGTNRAVIRTGMLKKGLGTICKLRAYLIEEGHGFHNSDFQFLIDLGHIELA